jgi:nucleolar complex protein 2
LELLETVLSKRPKPSSLKPMDLSVALRAPAAFVGTKIYVESVADEALELLARELALFSNHVSFPEMGLIVSAKLRRILKQGGRKAKCSGTLAQIVTKVRHSASFILA